MDDVSVIVDFRGKDNSKDDQRDGDNMDTGGCPCEDCSSNDNGCDYDYDCQND